MEAVHSDPSGRAESLNPFAPNLGFPDSLCNGVQSNEHNVCVTRKHNGPTSRSSLQNPLCISLHLWHSEYHLLGTNLRQSHCALCKKVHWPPTRLHTAPTRRDRPCNLHHLHACCWLSRGCSPQHGQKKQPLRRWNRSHLNLLPSASVLSHRSCRSFHQHWSNGVLLRTGTYCNEKLVCSSSTHH